MTATINLPLQSDRRAPDASRIREALGFVPPDDRDTWVRMGMAIKSELGDVGFDVWDAWGQQSESYSAKDSRDVWKSVKANGKVTVATLFREAKEHGWPDDGASRKPTPAEIAERKRQDKEKAKAEEAEIEQEREQTREKAQAIMQAAREARDDHPYLLRKKVSVVATLREIDAGVAAAILKYSPKSGGEPLSGRLLVVPIKQGNGISSLELIDEAGRKAALAGRGTKAGGYWLTERLPDGGGAGLTLLIGEGVATVLSAREVTGHPGVAALSSNNLLAVARIMRKRFPKALLVLLTDLVKSSGEPDPHAVEAVRAVSGKLAVPDFGPDRPEGASDFNDLATLHGPEAVKQCIEAAVEPSEGGTNPRDASSISAGDSDPFPSEEKRPCYVVLDDWMERRGRKVRPGVYHCGITTAKRETPLTPFETWFCSPLHVEAVTFDAQDNNYGRLLRFKPTISQWREWSMPMELLAGDGSALRAELLAMGVELDPFKARQLLPDYLQREHPKRTVRCALQTGWAGQSFILPDQVIGPDAADVVFQSGERGHEEHTKAGTLAGWQVEIAARAVGNPLLLLALSAGFAGPMLARCNAEGGGIHIVGDSSTRKTTAIEAACSIWGGENYKRSWRSTANGMEGAAALFNDCLLALDEISECDPKEVGAIVYALSNGRGKQRASRTGAARSVVRWRCFVLSSGERTIATTMHEGGSRGKAGQFVRLLDLPATRRHGA